MLPALLGLTTLAVACVAARAAQRVAFTILLATIVLVPASLAVPTGGVTPLLTVHRVVLLGVLVGLLWRHRRASVWKVSPTVLAFIVYLAVVLLTGIVLAPAVLDVGDQVTAYLLIVEQLVVLVVCTALVRVDPDATWFLRPIAGVLLVSAAIAGVEHLTGNSWSHWLFRAVPSQQENAAAQELAVRGGTVRVRAGNEFPLGYAWVSAAMLPAFLVVMLCRWRFAIPVMFAGAALVVATIYWSFARSAIVGLIAAIVVLGILARDRRVASLVLVAAALGIAGFIAAPALSQHFSTSVDAGSIDVREQRVPIVLAAVADHPWTGLGLTGLKTLGLQGVDATYLLSYGVTGAGGLAGLIGLLTVAFLGVARGAFTDDRGLRLAAAALSAGVITLIGAGGAFDAMALTGTANVLWVLVAVGIVVAERGRGPVTLLAAPPLFAPVVSLAALAGAVLVVTSPTHHARQVQFSVLPVAQQAAFYDPVEPGNTLINTVCDTARAEAAAMSDVSVTCRNLFSAPGLGALRVEADSPAGVTDALAAIERATKRAGVDALVPIPETPLVGGRPTLRTTAPLWLPVVVVMLLFAWSGVVLAAARRRVRSRRPAP